MENGALKLKTGEDQATEETGSGGISVFAQNGQDWEDIEVQLDFNELRNDVAPGPLVRVQDTRIKNLGAWWFQYVSGSSDCTMRPHKNGRDGGWLYQGTLKKPLSQGSWYHAKYRVVDDRFVWKNISK